MSKFCPNLSFLFIEHSFPERYKFAKNVGFKAVESGFPFGFTLKQIVDAKNQSGIQQILINTFTGDVSKGELGFAALPGHEDDFKNSLNTTIEFAKALNVKKIHIMSGIVTDVTSNHDQVYEKNLKIAIDIFSKENIIGLIEPINNISVPNYYLNSYEKALYFIKKINSPNLKLMLDIFHLQQIQGNITKTISDLINYIGHVQIAQVPNRNEPNSPGEINYPFILSALQKAGYNDWIGLEYKAAGDVIKGFNWIKELGYEL